MLLEGLFNFRLRWRAVAPVPWSLLQPRGPESGALGLRLQEQRVVNLLHLRFGFFDGAAVVDDEIGGLELGFVGGLRHHPARDFETGGLRVEIESLRPAIDALLLLQS